MDTLARHRELALLGIAVRPVEFRAVDDFADLTGEPDDLTLALIEALDYTLSDRRDATFESKHPRGPGGEFSTIAGRIMHALDNWAKGNGSEDPLHEFQGPKGREQLRRAAKARGIELKRGATIEEIKQAILDSHRQNVLASKAEKPPTAPGATAGHQRFSITHNGQRLDVGIFGSPTTGKLAIYRENDHGVKSGRAIKNFDDIGGVAQWARQQGHTDLADYAEAEARRTGVNVPAVPTKRAPRKAAPKADLAPAFAHDLFTPEGAAKFGKGMDPTVPASRDQARIDAQKAVSQVLDEIHQLRQDGASDKAMEARIRSRAKLVGLNPKTTDELVSAATGDRSGLDSALARIAQTAGVNAPGNRDAEVEQAIRDAHAAIMANPNRRQHGLDTFGPTVGEIRQQLGDKYTKAEVDAALTRLNRQPGVNLLPEENQKVLTAQDRLDAVNVGGRDYHALQIQGAKPAATAVSARADREAAVRDVLEAPGATKTRLPGGNMGGAMLVTAPDGRRAALKELPRDPSSAKYQADAEVLSGRVQEALGLRVPAIVRQGDHALGIEFVDGKSFDKFTEVPAGVVDSPDGRMLALSDLITQNSDRAGGNNWIQAKDGRLVGLDQTGAFSADDGWYGGGSVFAKPFVERMPGTYKKQLREGVSFTSAELSSARHALESLRPDFEALGRQRWYDAMLSRLAALEQHERHTNGQGADYHALQIQGGAKAPAPAPSPVPATPKLTPEKLAAHFREIAHRASYKLARDRGPFERQVRETLQGMSTDELKSFIKYSHIYHAGPARTRLKVGGTRTQLIERIVHRYYFEKITPNLAPKPFTSANLRSSEGHGNFRALGHDTTPGHDELHHYWVAGPGLAKWAESPRPWTTLVTELTKYVGPEKAKIYASRWFIEVFHFAAGSDLNRVTHGQPPRGHRVGPG